MRKRKKQDRARTQLLVTIRSITQNTHMSKESRAAFDDVVAAVRGGKEVTIFRAINRLARALQS